MLEWLTNFCTTSVDFVLGWSLSLPRDVVLLIVALLTSLILTGVRVFTTNQEWLKRCKADKKRLSALIRQAKARSDKEAVTRHKNTIQLIALKGFSSEGLPLLVSLIPIAMLATWAFSRLAYLAPQPGKEVTLTVEFPAYAHGSVVTLVPQEGMKCDGGWARQIKSETLRFDSLGRLPVPVGPIFETVFPPRLAGRGDRDPNNTPSRRVERAVWKISCQKDANAYPLLFRFQGETLPHRVGPERHRDAPSRSART